MKSKLKNSESSLVNAACVSAAEEEDESSGGVRVLKSSSIEIEPNLVSEVTVKSKSVTTTATGGLNNLNRTHSNSSCNSDSDYNSIITNSTSSASCSSPLIDSKAPSINSSIGTNFIRILKNRQYYNRIY